MDKQELNAAWKMDQIADAEQAEEQAANGPHYPELGITRESLLKYAAECRAKAGEPAPVFRKV